jgi:hypothetical protein
MIKESNKYPTNYPTIIIKLVIYNNYLNNPLKPHQINNYLYLNSWKIYKLIIMIILNTQHQILEPIPKKLSNNIQMHPKPLIDIKKW